MVTNSSSANAAETSNAAAADSAKISLDAMFFADLRKIVFLHVF